MKKILLTLLILISLTACSNTEISSSNGKTNSFLSTTTEYINEIKETILKKFGIVKEISGRHIVELDNKFDYEITNSRRNYLEAEYTYLNRFDIVTIIDEDDRYYYYKDNNLLLGIDKRYLRDPSEELYSGFNGYTRYGSNLYPDLNLRTNYSIHTFSKNDIVYVIDEIEDMYYVEFEGTYGFMYKSQVSKTKLVTYVAPAPVEEPSYSGGGGGGSSSGGGNTGGGSSDTGGGSSDTGGGDTGGGGSSDSGSGSGGGEITPSGDGEEGALAFYNNHAKVVLLDNKLNMEMVVLTYNCPAYIHVYDRLEEIKYTEEKEDTLDVLVNGYHANVPKDSTDLGEPYDPWDGYTYNGSEVYYEYYLENVMLTCKKNDEVHVLDKVGRVYIVELEDGTIGYMQTDDVSSHKLVTYVAPAPVEEPSYSGGGGGSNSGGGSSDSGGSGSSGGWGPDVF